MKKLFLSALLTGCSMIAWCQSDTIKKPIAYPRMDTIVYYLIDSESMSIEKGAVIYKVNSRVVNEKQWKKMTIGISKIKICTPCIVKTYNAKDTLVSIGVQYRRCDIGSYTAFYPDGRVRISGQYKENTTGKWDKASLSLYCSKKDGLWTYYTPSGKVKTTELYKDGRLISKTPMK
jgi:hypothetical protein